MSVLDTVGIPGSIPAARSLSNNELGSAAGFETDAKTGAEEAC